MSSSRTTVPLRRSVSPTRQYISRWVTFGKTTGTDTCLFIVLPHGTGGGCVTSGPFANMTVNLGPDGLLVINGSDSSAWEFNYNPRCFKRDLTDYALTRFANTSSVLSLLRDAEDIWTFETEMQGPEGKNLP